MASFSAQSPQEWLLYTTCQRPSLRYRIVHKMYLILYYCVLSVNHYVALYVNVTTDHHCTVWVTIVCTIVLVCVCVCVCVWSLLWVKRCMFRL